ncbi:sensor histidine kinase [Actinomadura parmotrematis]|uniref:ATP-binding protein n=1 Tax=Actinomadura parmotrematis TaxID=2864039 RepID=A0ABS7FWZ8_9ACTN|nr:histidine kinase [Actinomadura parmotrematis]MBW8484955.1 ATP-binding protein [Actinomadura parmotrematis]
MGSSASERPGGPAALPERAGDAFRMLMQIRLLIAAVTLLLLPRDELTVAKFLLVLSIVVLSWLAARNWCRVVPLVAAHPLLFAVDVCVSFTILGIGGVAGPFFLSTVVTATLAGLLYRWQGMLAVAALQIACYFAAYTATAARDVLAVVPFQTLIGQPCFYLLAGFAGATLRRLLDEHDAQTAARRAAEAQAAAAQERARLAREFHDSLAKTLRGINLAASALPNWLARDQTRAAAEARRIASACETASLEARDLLTRLRDDPLAAPLDETVRRTAEQWGATAGVTVALAVDDCPEPSVDARYELLAILGEALTNVERHAHGRTVRVGLHRDGDDVVLTVHDDGLGFQPRELVELAGEGHYGLIGLHERAGIVGGTVRVDSRPGAGTLVTARLPARRDDEPAEVS